MRRRRLHQETTLSPEAGYSSKHTNLWNNDLSFNKFVNGVVDRLDQQRPTTPTQREDIHLKVSVFSCIFDPAIRNAIEVYQKHKGGGAKEGKSALDYQDLKLAVAVRLV